MSSDGGAVPVARANDGGFVAVAKDLAAGSVGGMAGIVFGHPLDVVKTRLQAASSPLRQLSTYECLMKTWTAEGWGGLYRGIAPPLVAVAAYQSVAFAAFEWGFVQANRLGIQDEAHARRVAAVFSGACSVFVTVPTDAVKIQMQLEFGRSDGALADTTRCARKLVATRGVTTLYRGFAACQIRDMPGMVGYFEGTTQTKRFLLRLLGRDADWRADLIGGGVGGVCGWVVALPMDVVKTVSQEAAAQGRRLSVLAAASEVRKRDGLLGFFRGAVPLMIRGFPVSAITFLVYQKAKLLLGLPSAI